MEGAGFLEFSRSDKWNWLTSICLVCFILTNVSHVLCNEMISCDIESIDWQFETYLSNLMLYTTFQRQDNQ